MCEWKREKKDLSEVGFEPTPPMETRNLGYTDEQCKLLTLESGALDRSAILTTGQRISTLNFVPRRLSAIQLQVGITNDDPT